MNSSTAHRKLNKHATSVLIGGVFLFFSVLLYLSLCAMPCEYAHIEGSYEADKYRKQVQDRKPHQALLVILVLTGPKYFEHRDTMRETWLSSHKKDKDVKIFFAIGAGSLTAEELGTLEYENSLHGDLLLLKELNDTYYNLASKVLESFRWLDHHANFRFLLKVDDDTFVQLDKLLDEMKAVNPSERLYWGFFDGRARVKKLGKWAEPNWILCDTYTPYARGGGYILTADLVHFIAKNSPYLQKFQSEDVSIGAWLAPLQIKRQHDVRFDTEYRSRGCNNKYLVTHKQSTQDMKDKWTNLKTNGLLCKKEFQSRNSYEYNWNVPPSQCCMRNNTNIP